MAGIFHLATAADLREKLRRDLAKFKREPLNPDAAFNFFVTAEHMLDWVHPKKINKHKRTDERKASILLQVCSHLANGAKHFEVDGLHHDSVSSRGTAGGYFNASYFAPSYFSNAYFGAGRTLIVRLKSTAAAHLGQTVKAVQLAEMVMDYWDKHIHKCRRASARTEKLDSPRPALPPCQ